MSAELVRKVAVVPLEEIRLCGRETDAWDSAKDRRSDGGGWSFRARLYLQLSRERAGWSVLTPGRVQLDVKVLDCCYSLMRTFLDYKLDFSKLIFSEWLQVFFDLIPTSQLETWTETENRKTFNWYIIIFFLELPQALTPSPLVSLLFVYVYYRLI